MKIDIILRTAIGLLCALLVLVVFCSVIFDFQGFKVMDTSKISLDQAERIATSIAIVGVIMAGGIYYADMCVYAKQLYKYNQKNHGLISEYRCLITEKEKQCKQLELKCSLLFSEKASLEKSTQQEHKEQVCKLQGRIETLCKEIDEIKVQKAELERRIKNVQVEPNYANVCLNKLKQTESYRHLRTLANEGKKGEEYLFVELEAEITALYPIFTKQLFDYFPKMNERQLNLCLLLKAEFSNNDIASLMCLHHSSVSHLKSRIYASMCNVPNEASNLSDFLKTL